SARRADAGDLPGPEQVLRGRRPRHRRRRRGLGRDLGARPKGLILSASGGSLAIIIASAAKQSTSRHKERMDCFAALAMTAGYRSVLPPAWRGAHHIPFGKSIPVPWHSGAVDHPPPAGNFRFA